MHAFSITRTFLAIILLNPDFVLSIPWPQPQSNQWWTPSPSPTSWSDGSSDNNPVPAAPQPTGSDGSSGSGSGYDSNWATKVTWPVGCESWANPCPAGAPVSGGGVAAGGGLHSATAASRSIAPGSGYENPFTSYTTMTDSEGVITGMPSKVTIPAGIESVATSVVNAQQTTVNTVARNATLSTVSRPSSPNSTSSSGFIVASGDARSNSAHAFTLARGLAMICLALM